MSIILKASQDPAEDFYIEFSTIADKPARWGSARSLRLDPERKERADETGTSMFPTLCRPRGEGGIETIPGQGAYDSKGILIRDFGSKLTDFWLPREHFHDFFVVLASDPSLEGQDRALKLFGEDLED